MSITIFVLSKSFGYIPYLQAKERCIDMLDTRRLSSEHEENIFKFKHVIFLAISQYMTKYFKDALVVAETLLRIRNQ